MRLLANFAISCALYDVNLEAILPYRILKLFTVETFDNLDNNWCADTLNIKHRNTRYILFDFDNTWVSTVRIYHIWKKNHPQDKTSGGILSSKPILFDSPPKLPLSHISRQYINQFRLFVYGSAWVTLLFVLISPDRSFSICIMQYVFLMNSLSKPTIHVWFLTNFLFDRGVAIYDNGFL